MKMFKMKAKTSSKAAKTLVMLAAAGIIVYAVMEMAKDKHDTKKVGAARWVPPVMAVVPEVSRPVSTPTMLASKNGLGGGAFVGSQSLKLGGSSFRGRKVTFDEFGFRNTQPWPLYKPPAPEAPSSPTPMPADPSAAPVAPVAPASLGSSNLAKGRRSSSPFGGSVVSRPRAPTDIVIETRDGYIVQPRA